MNDDQLSLWKRIQAFEFDDADATFAFSHRLARDNGWNGAFAGRVLGEYRRFLFLAMEAGHPVTPSDQVDQAWHLHLVYTRSYWDELCGRVLGRPLHHGPTRGGDAERDKYDDWYQDTLVSYERLFGETPPSDIWPPHHIRFGEDVEFERVNLARNWVLPRPRFRGRMPLVGGLLLLLGLAGCADGRDGDALWIGAGVFLLALVLPSFLGKRARRARKLRRELTRETDGKRRRQLRGELATLSGRRPGKGGGCGGFFGWWGGCGGGGDDDSGCGGGGCGGGGCGGCGGCGG